MAAGEHNGGGLPDEVRAILPDLTERTGHDDWRPFRAPLQRRDCRIHFLRSGSFRVPEIVLKTYRGDTAGRYHARTLFQKSRSFHRAASPDCSVPEHLLFVQRENALVMEYIDAPLAGNVLIRAFHSPATRARVIGRAARWLRWFHDQSGVAEAPFDPAPVVGKMKRMREKILAREPGALDGDPLLAECMARCEAAARTLAGTPLPHAMAHGDYTPFNLFLGDEVTYGFDYSASRRLPVYQDICRFLLYLDIYRIRPASDAELDEFGGRRVDYEAFVSAYGESGVAPRGIWRVCQFVEITRRLASHTLQRSKGKSHMLRFIETPQLRRKARRLADLLG